MDIVKTYLQHKQTNNFTLGQVERATGISRRQLSSIEKGEVKNPRDRTKEKLAKFVLETRINL